jgi:hypothetical protein
MTAVEPNALRTSRIATEAIHSSLPAGYSIGFSFGRFCALQRNRRWRLTGGSKSWFLRHAESKPEDRPRA